MAVHRFVVTAAYTIGALLMFAAILGEDRKGIEAVRQNARKTKAQLIQEHVTLRQRLAALEATTITHAQVEAALLERETRYWALVNGSIQDVLIDKNFVIRFANPAALRIFGYPSVDDLVGQPLSALLPLHEHDRIHTYAAAHLQG